MRRHRSSSVKSNKCSSIKKAATTSQIRIIGGRFKRQFIPFINAQGLRPTPDRLRETLFNWIQFEIHDTNVLDLCAGSGVLGLEALSRGAAHTTFIELKPKQAQLIKQSSQKLKLTKNQTHVCIGDALNIIPTLARTLSNIEYNNTNTIHTNTPIYHLVFVDPPYDSELWVPMIHALIRNKLVTNDTLFYIEDRRPLEQTLHGFNFEYTLIKKVEMGQIFAQILKINCRI